MKLNNKGMTLVEIIISIALISIVLLFMFSLLINVNDMNISSNINSTYLVNKALIIKNIEEDIRDANKIEIYGCKNEDTGQEGIRSFYTSYGHATNYFYNASGVEESTLKANMCLEFHLTKNGVDEISYLGIYYYKAREFYVISYINPTQNIKATRELPDYIDYNVEGDKLKFINGSSAKYIFKYSYLSNISTSTTLSKKYDALIIGGVSLSSTASSTRFAVISIPIIGSDGKDYTINIPLSPKMT